MMRPDYYGGYGMSYTFHPLLFIFYLLLIGFGLYLLVSVYLSVRKDQKGVVTPPPTAPTAPTPDEAIKILRERYAKGEIKEEEFEKMKKALEK